MNGRFIGDKLEEVSKIITFSETRSTFSANKTAKEMITFMSDLRSSLNGRSKRVGRKDDSTTVLEHIGTY